MIYCMNHEVHPTAHSIKRSWSRTWRQKLRQRPRRIAAYQLVPHGLFSYTSQDHLPAMGQALPLESFIKKMPPQAWPKGSLMEAIPQLKFPPPDMSGLCQVEKKITKWTLRCFLPHVKYFYNKTRRHYQKPKQLWKEAQGNLICNRTIKWRL